MTDRHADETPSATLHLAWDQANGWGRMARGLKASQSRERVSSALLAVAGGGLIAGAPLAGGPMGPFLATAGAVLVFASSFIGREVLVPEKELRWTRARTLSEALKREVWLHAAKAPPYVGDDRNELLEQRVTALQGAQDLPVVEAVAGTPEPLPKVETIQDYVRHRLQHQVDWYERRSREFSAKLQRWRRISLGLGLFAGVAGVIASASLTGMPELTAFVPVLTTATAAIGASLHAQRFAPLAATYSETARKLRFRRARWEDAATRNDDQAARQLVADTENILAAENDAWRAEWDREPPRPENEHDSP